MNYRHGFHAGNFADVLKHASLIAVLLHLRKKDKPFAVIDTHAGRGRYDLSGEEASRSGEAEAGIKRLACVEALPEMLSEYRRTVESFSPFYPGSPLIAAKFLREGDRLVAVEKHAEEYEALKIALADYAAAQAVKGDGYAELQRSLPPQERRGLVLIDPPYENEREFLDAVQALASAHRRFATGIYMLWYPSKSRGDVDAASGELLNAGVTSLLRLTLNVGDPGEPAPGRQKRLSETGLLIVNAPYGFAEAMEPVLAELSRRLAVGPGARAGIEKLA